MPNEMRSSEFEKILKSALESVSDKGTCVDTGGSVGEMYGGSRDYWVKYRGEVYFITAKKFKLKTNAFTGQHRVGVAGPATEPVTRSAPVFSHDLTYKEIENCLKNSGQGNGFDDVAYNNGIITALNILQKAKN